jgi:hypothetical protein
VSPRKFAAGTVVSAGRTKGEIEDMLMSRGVSQFGTLADSNTAAVLFGFGGLTYRMSLPLPDSQSDEFWKVRVNASSTREATPDQAANKYAAEVNRRWRALAAVVKAKLIAVEEGITTFEDEFLSHVVTDNGQTLGTRMIPELQKAASLGRVPTILALEGRSK